MKKSVSILLAFLMLFLTLKSSFLYLSFKWQQDQIAKTLCVEKDVVESSCKGKCYLKKQLKKEQEKEKKQVAFKKLLNEFYCFQQHELEVGIVSFKLYYAVGQFFTYTRAFSAPAIDIDIPPRIV